MLKMMKKIGTILLVVVFVALLLAGASLVFLTLPIAGSNKVLIVLSDSMKPAITSGSIVIAQPATKFSTGDVVSYLLPGTKNFVTHRIVSSQEKNGQWSYQTKGDANNALDQKLVSEKDINGKVILTIPYLGKLVGFAKTPGGLATMVIFPAGFVIGVEILNIIRELSKKRRASSLAVTCLPLFLLPILLVSRSTFAYFSDTGFSNDNAFTASSIFPGSAGSVVINEVNWAGSNGDGNDEWIELKNMTSLPINLTNWVVENLGTGSGPGANITIPSGSIPANGFFLISQFGKAGSKINVDPDMTTTSVSLNNGGEQLVLKNNSGTTIDTANGTGAWFRGSNSTPKKSMERKSPPGDGTVTGSWQDASTHTNMDSGGPTDEFATPKAENGL